MLENWWTCDWLILQIQKIPGGNGGKAERLALNKSKTNRWVTWHRPYQSPIYGDFKWTLLQTI